MQGISFHIAAPALRNITGSSPAVRFGAVNKPGLAQMVEVPGFGPVKQAGYKEFVTTLKCLELQKSLPGNPYETPQDHLYRHSKNYTTQGQKAYQGPCLDLFNRLQIMSKTGEFAHPALPYIVLQTLQSEPATSEKIVVGDYGPVKKAAFQDLVKILKKIAGELTPGSCILSSPIGTLYMHALCTVQPGDWMIPGPYQGEHRLYFNERQLMDIQGNWAHPAIPHIVLRMVDPHDQYSVR